MSDDAAFHEGYRKALEEVLGLVAALTEVNDGRVEQLIADLEKRIERARCLTNSALAAGATGDQGY